MRKILLKSLIFPDKGFGTLCIMLCQREEILTSWKDFFFFIQSAFDTCTFTTGLSVKLSYILEISNLVNLTETNDAFKC